MILVILIVGAVATLASVGFAVSQALGERVLLPAVRGASAETILITDGFSCREQIRQNSPRHALHLAEVLALKGQG